MLAALAMTASTAHAQQSSSQQVQEAVAIAVSTGPTTSTPRHTRQTIIAAPSIGAPALSNSSIETCLGSASGGVSFPGGGFSLGGTTKDEDCNLRLYARQLYNMGAKNAAFILQCLNPQVNYAMALAGTPCPNPPQGPSFISNFQAAPQQPVAYASANAVPPAAAPTRPGPRLNAKQARARGCTIQQDASGKFYACP